MLAPAQLLDHQAYVPFLFGPTKQDERRVTHAALSALIVHSTDINYPSMAPWLHEHRVEKFAGLPASDWSDKAETYYVVTACQELRDPIPYSELILTRDNRPVSAHKARGYAGVFLPMALTGWLEQARLTWERLAPSLPAVR